MASCLIVSVSQKKIEECTQKHRNLGESAKEEYVPESGR